MAEEAKSRVVTLSEEAFAVVMRQVRERSATSGIIQSRSSVASAIITEAEPRAADAKKKGGNK